MIDVDIKYFNLNLFRIGFQKGTLKYNHSTLNGSSTPSEFKITCQSGHVCYEREVEVNHLLANTL